MVTLQLIYTNAAFSSMIDFQVESALSYDTALEKYGFQQYISKLLLEAKKQIKEFGRKVDFPHSLSNYLAEAEMDYVLQLIETDVDAFVDGHVYVRVPSKHAISLIDRGDNTKIWRVNGTGLNGLFLARKSSTGITAAAVSFEEARSDYITLSPMDDQRG